MLLQTPFPIAGALPAGDGAILPAPTAAALPPSRAAATPFDEAPRRRFAEMELDGETGLDDLPQEHWDALFSDLAADPAIRTAERRLRDDRAQTPIDPVKLAAAEQWFFDQLDVIDADAFDTLDSLGPEGVIRRWEAATFQAVDQAQLPQSTVASFTPDGLYKSFSEFCENDRRARDVADTIHDVQVAAAPPMLFVPRLSEGGLAAFREAGINALREEFIGPGRIEIHRADPFPEPGGDAFRALSRAEWRAHPTAREDEDAPSPVLQAALFGALTFGAGVFLGPLLGEAARRAVDLFAWVLL